jgi:hypothetical protein
MAKPKKPVPKKRLKPAERARIAELFDRFEAQVRARLGAPDVARAEGAGGLWTYRFRGCALMVFFRREGGQVLRVSGFSAGPRRRGQATPTVDGCMAQALDAREDPSQADDPIQAILDAPSGR